MLSGIEHNRPAGRYIKQIRVRSSELQYGEDHVITAARLIKEGDYISLQHTGFAAESELLVDIDDELANKETIKSLSESGMSIRMIAETLGLSKSKVQRILRQ